MTVIIFLILVIIISIIIIVITSNSKTSSRENFEPVFHGAKPGTKPQVEATHNMPPGSVVKVEYFYMPSCPYCVKYNPIFDKAVENLKPDFPKLEVRKYNIREAGNDELMKKSTGKKEGNTVPTVVLWYDNGLKLSLNAAQRNHLELYVRYTE